MPEWRIDVNDMTPIGARDQTLRHPADLADAGLTSPDRVAALEEVAARYAVAITPAMTRLIDGNDPADPIARQFVPDTAELVTTPEEHADPIGDDAHEVTEGLVHRYPDRVLLKLVSACAVYCRFCFRRETVGQGEGLSREALTRALAYVREHLGGDRQRRRPARRLAAAARRPDAGACDHRPRQGRPLPHPRAGSRAGAGDP